MNTKKLSAGALIEGLSGGWQSSAALLPEEFLCRWNSLFKCRSWEPCAAENSFQFVADLGEIRLKGMSEAVCLLLAGQGAQAARALDQFSKRAGQPGRVGFVLTISETAHASACDLCAGGRFLLLDRKQLEELLQATDPHLLLKRHLWSQIPRRRLVPYSIVLPAEGHMFFGRENELARLRDEEGVSFAIAGPGRIGKTSLLKQHEIQLIREHDPRVSRKFPISLYGCSHRTADSLARFIAMRIESSKRSDRVTVDDLMDFLRYQHWKLGGPLQLLLDETDGACGNEAMGVLGDAAKRGFCRLVLCGRGVLLKTVMTDKPPLGCRLELLRLEPLEDAPARRLLMKPLADLGVEVERPEAFASLVLRLTGRMPHLVQFYGEQLAELAIQANISAISTRHAELVRWDFQTAQFFTSALSEIEDPGRRLIALLLLKFGRQDVSIPLVQRLAVENGFALGHQEAFALMNELVIDNVLCWNNGSYRIANESLYEYANRFRFLDGALEEARRAVAAARTTATVRK